MLHAYNVAEANLARQCNIIRYDRDKISTIRPILVWHRSVREFIVNLAARTTFGVTEDFVAKLSEGARKQSNFA